MSKAICPACKKIVELPSTIKVQDTVTCNHCKTMVEFVRKYPPTLELVEDPQIKSYYRNISIRQKFLE